MPKGELVSVCSSLICSLLAIAERFGHSFVYILELDVAQVVLGSDRAMKGEHVPNGDDGRSVCRREPSATKYDAISGTALGCGFKNELTNVV